MVDQQGLLPLQQIDREEEAPARNEGATINRHVGQNSTFVLPAEEIEVADYAFGSNPPYRLRRRFFGAMSCWIPQQAHVRGLKAGASFSALYRICD